MVSCRTSQSARWCWCPYTYLFIQPASSSHPILSLLYAPYTKWVDHMWLTLVWQFAFLEKIGIDVLIQLSWQPPTTHQHGSFLIANQLLQTIPASTHISRYIKAARTHITPLVIKSQQDPCRYSTLSWPTYPWPPTSAWTQWCIILQYICHSSMFLQPLGAWTAKPHNTGCGISLTHKSYIS
jgi:hypothetical protein